MLKVRVANNRANASGHPRIPTERAKISGSIVGEAIQKAMTGARGTPLASNPAMMGTTVQEQKGLKAPTNVAKIMARATLAWNARLMAPSSFKAWTRTLRIMLIAKAGQTLRTAETTKSAIYKISFMVFIPLSYFYD
jgi:hypothetical protein